MIRTRKGLDVPIAGSPDQSIESGPSVRSVALLGDDYVGMKPTMNVQVGDRVKLGQVLFTDKKTAGVRFTSPASGRVSAINRGAKRKLESVVIELAGDERERFGPFRGIPDRAGVREALVSSGLWTALRTRPYSKVPPPESVPHSIFVTAIDTHPLAADPAVVLQGHEDEFGRGLDALARLTDGAIHLCQRPGASIPGSDRERVTLQEFAGPHPAGLPGTHIHFLDPVNEKRTVWYVNYQDVMAIGHLFATGRLSVDRVVSLAGPTVDRPCLVRTRIGASTDDLVSGRLRGNTNRVISGSVLDGRTAAESRAYLGRYHLQVSAISDERSRPFLGWLGLGWGKFSIKPAFASALGGSRRRFHFTTSSQGDPRTIVPIGMYEKVVPLDLLPTALLKSIVVGDTEHAQALGCLELDEEDLALCSFVCPGKTDFGPPLRNVLEQIEKEG
jgi:Na+-transporting NADH:ubiquinone oxidoreductase subunit A